MNQETFIVAYEGKSREVIDFATARAKKSGARLHVVHVLEWSPYSFLTPEELEERHGKRESELKRGREVVVGPVVEELKSAGFEVEGEVRHGSPPEVISDIARKIPDSLVFVGRSGASSIAERILGSVTMGLVQISPVPVVVVP